MKELKLLRDPEGKPLFEEVLLGKNLYKGGCGLVPDLVVVPREGVEVYCGLKGSMTLECMPHWRANHRRKGIFIAYGKDIKKSAKIKDVRIFDVAPTILFMFGKPIPKDMDGRVLREIFKESSSLARRKPRFVDPSYYAKIVEMEKIRRGVESLKGKLFKS